MNMNATTQPLKVRSTIIMYIKTKNGQRKCWHGEMQRDFDFFRNRILNYLDTLPLEWAKIKCKYVDRKPNRTSSLPTIVMFVVCYRLRDISSRNMRDLDIDLQLGLRWNVNMSIDRQCRTFYLMVIAMLTLSVTVYEIFAVDMPMSLTLTLILRTGNGQL